MLIQILTVPLLYHHVLGDNPENVIRLAGAGLLAAALLALRRSADPPADAAIAAMLRPWDDAGAACVNREHLREANAAIAQWCCNGELADWRAPAGTAPEVAAALEAYVASTHLLPAWAEPARIEQAERVFMEQGLLSCALLFCASLPECYVLPALAEVLITTGQLESRAEHRIRSTAAMIFPVMMEGGLTRPEGSGVAQVLKVRLIHAMVRHLVLRASPAEALTRAHEPPPPAATGDAMTDALLARGFAPGAINVSGLNRLDISTTINGGSSYIRGIELSGQAQFVFLPSPLDGFGASASATFLKGRTKLTDGREIPVQEQPTRTYAFSLFFQKWGVDASVSYKWNRSYLTDLNDDPDLNLDQGAFGRWDARISYAITPRIRIFAEGVNLNNEPTSEFQGGTKLRNTQYEYVGRTYYLGLSAGF
jgi:hypothetical protein